LVISAFRPEDELSVGEGVSAGVLDASGGESVAMHPAVNIAVTKPSRRIVERFFMLFEPQN